MSAPQSVPELCRSCASRRAANVRTCPTESAASISPPKLRANKKRLVIPTEAGANATAQWRNLLSWPPSSSCRPPQSVPELCRSCASRRAANVRTCPTASAASKSPPNSARIKKRLSFRPKPERTRRRSGGTRFPGHQVAHVGPPQSVPELCRSCASRRAANVRTCPTASAASKSPPKLRANKKRPSFRPKPERTRRRSGGTRFPRHQVARVQAPRWW